MHSRVVRTLTSRRTTNQATCGQFSGEPMFRTLITDLNAQLSTLEVSTTSNVAALLYNWMTVNDEKSLGMVLRSIRNVIDVYFAQWNESDRDGVINQAFEQYQDYLKGKA